MSKQQLAERVLEKIDGIITKSELVPLEEADESCRNICGHIGIKDEKGWLYDDRLCLVCERSLGVI